MAVLAARDMQERLRQYNRSLTEQGYAPLSHGIGIHTGEVLAGNIGSPQRLSYAQVGDAVNLASRLQSLTRELGREILLSAATAGALTQEISLLELRPAGIKGKTGTVRIFALQA